MFNSTIVSGGLVRKSELFQKENKKPFISLVLALNYSERLDDGSYKDVHTRYLNCLAFGKLATNIASSDFPLGTRLVASGQLKGRVVPAYTNQNGETVPEHGEEVLFLDNLSPDLSMGNVFVKIVKGTEPQPSTNSFSNPAPSQTQNTFTNNDFNMSSSPAPSSGGTSSSSNNDPFADLFN